MKPSDGIIAFIEENRERFYRVAFTYAKDENDALDIVHNTIVKALQQYRTLKNREYLKTWFYRILINESINFIKKRNRTVLFETVESNYVTENESEKSDRYIDLYSALDKLPSELKTVILLRFFEDMKLSEISTVTSSNLSTTKSRLYKALEVLKIGMEEADCDR